MKVNALIIEDERLVSWSLKKHLEKLGFKVSLTEFGREGIQIAQESQPDLLFVDFRLPDINGIEVLRALQDFRDEIIFFFMTAYGTQKVSVEALKLGAYKYLNKPLEFEELSILITRAMEEREISKNVDIVKQLDQQIFQIGDFVSSSPTMQHIIESVQKIVESDSGTILLLGETGTGKDTLARVIHEHSPRRDKAFITVNCAALSESLLSSELFGHEKGAFTDAKTRKSGQVELATGGTIFLDEIGEIPINFQSKLLRFIETQKFYRVGGTRELSVNVRIIASTNRDLLQEIENNNFRKDLFYRLNVISLTLPPLRERKEDIKGLVERFIELFNSQFNFHVKGISKDALEIISQYGWPGNVRELKNTIERIFLLERPKVIESWHFPDYINKNSRNLKTDSKSDSIVYNYETLFKGKSFAEIEQLLVKWALENVKGNQTHAARLLGLTRDQIRYKMIKHGLLN